MPSDVRHPRSRRRSDIPPRSLQAGSGLTDGDSDAPSSGGKITRSMNFARGLNAYMSVEQDKWQKFERLMGSACRQGYVLLPRKPKRDGGEQCSRSQIGIAGNIARSAVWLAHSAVESVAAPKARSKRIGRFGRLVRASGSGSTSASVRQRPNSQLLPRVSQVHGRAKQLLHEIDQGRKFESAPSLASRGGRRGNLFKITLASQHAE